MAVEVDWKGIARSAKLLGGEGENLLLLKTKAKVGVESLDGAIPDADEGPANGGWFATPQGWMLFIEGLDEQVNPWIEHLAASLAANGVAGTIAGARTAGRQTWAIPLEALPGWHGLLAYTPEPGFQLYRHAGWGCGSESLAAAVDHAIGWMCARGGRPMADIDLRADFWVDAKTAGRILRDQAAANHVARSTSYQRECQELREVTITNRCALDLQFQSGPAAWQAVVAEFRASLVSSPMKHLSIATVSNLGWILLLDRHSQAAEFCDTRAYRYHPELWNEFTLDPCGIQILTDRHLEKANDLSGWRTTRLDDGHILVESRDLDAWFATPLGWADRLPASLLDQARSDFGEMILTTDRAHSLGLDVKPPHQGTLLELEALAATSGQADA